MKSIEELRKVLKSCTSEAGIEPDKFDTYWITAEACDMLIDEIEAEIAERYMKRPVDADGVPWYIGEEVDGCEIVAMAGYQLYYYDDGSETVEWCIARNRHHVKPRTLENIVADAIQYGHNGITGDRIEGKVAEFCAEIRELLGGDA